MARTVAGTEVGYHPSVLNPADEIVLASDFISLEDWIAQLSLSRSFPPSGVCEGLFKEKRVNTMGMKTIGVFISQVFNS